MLCDLFYGLCTSKTIVSIAFYFSLSSQYCTCILLLISCLLWLHRCQGAGGARWCYGSWGFETWTKWRAGFLHGVRDKNTLIISNYWTRLSKILWFVSGEQIIICRSQRLRQIIDLWDNDKSQYFAITEFNICFIIRSLSLFLIIIISSESG